ncbi:MAG TPA: hypothetical protein PKM88_01105 [bacterium]|nr:hypothetical protein [bacterium]
MNEMMAILLLFGAVLVSMQYRSRAERSRFARLERKVDELLRAAGRGEHAGIPISAEVRRLAHAGQPVAAMRQLRHETGIELREAKEIITALQQETP